MNTQTISVSEKLGGFPIEDTSAIFLKKFLWRNNTGANTALYNESDNIPLIWQEQICTYPIPDVPPNDFVYLNDTQIASTFGILTNELSSFRTYINGSNVFRIEQSISKPYILKFLNCRLQPFMGNLDESFSGTTPQSQINILSNPIPFNFKGSNWKGSIVRTNSNSELSLAGNDKVNPTQLPYIFDKGWFNTYSQDNHTLSENPINRFNAPAVTCYSYIGGFGNLSTGTNGGSNNSTIVSFDLSSIQAGSSISINYNSNSTITINNTDPSQWSTIESTIYYNGGTVIIGKETTEPSNGYTVDISGTLFADNMIAGSYTTFSDKRLKCNISTFETNTSLLNLGTFTFNYINNSTFTEIGLIAQEVEAVAPQIVREQHGYKTIQYDRISVLLLPLVKQQQQQIENLQNELKLLKNAVGLR